MAMSLKVIVPPHPLIKHWLSILREKNTPNILYSTGYEQLGKWLTYEALRDWLPYKKESIKTDNGEAEGVFINCLLYTSPSPRDRTRSRMPSSA